MLYLLCILALPSSNLQFLIPTFSDGDSKSLSSPKEHGHWKPRELQPEHDIGEPFSNIPSDAFLPDDTSQILSQLPNKKTVKKDLSHFESDRIPKSQYAQLVNRANSERYLALCEQYLQRELQPGDRQMLKLTGLLRNLCLSSLPFMSDRQSNEELVNDGIENSFGWNSNSKAAKDVMSLLAAGYDQLPPGKEKGKRNLAINDYGGYTGYLGNQGKGSNGKIGDQIVLFGKMTVGGGSEQLDDAYLFNHDWSNNYRSNPLNMLVNDEFSLGDPFRTEIKFNEVVVSEHVPQDSAISRDHYEIDQDLGGYDLEDFKASSLDKMSHDGNQRVGIEDSLIESSQRIKNVYPLSTAVHHAMTEGDSGYGQIKNDCVLTRMTAFLLNGMGDELRNMVNGHNFGRGHNLPCIHMYSLTFVGDNKSKDRRPMQSSWKKYWKKFGPLGGRREWTYLGGDTDRRKPWIVL